MDFKENYYFEKYEQLAVLADTQKCKTILSRNTDTNEIVVFKVMDKHGLDVYDRLKDLDNSNIVDVMDCFLHEDKCVAVEEFVNGKRLCDVLQKNIPVEVIVDYVRQICNGLKEVHNKNIVHRDLQPKNIIVDRHNHITIIDFDIARIRKEEADSDTEFLGTVGYASPEQFGFAQTDKRSDIYSLGVLIGDMVKPYAKTVREVSEEEIVYTGTSLTLEEHKIVERLVKMSRKCTEIAPEKRYKSIEEIEKKLKYIKLYNQDILELDELEELKPVMDVIHTKYPEVGKGNLGIGSTIFAVKPGDGSAREQAASCQKVLGGWANIANEYATKRYRSNLINWGMIPFVIDQGELPFHNLDYLFVPKIREAIADGKTEFEAYVVKDGALKPFTLRMGELTPDEKDIILKGCLINYYRG